MNTPTANDVLECWFLDEATGRMDLPQSQRWFDGGKPLDEALAARFGSVLALAREGRLDHWRDSASGTLALIILLDQFNRNINRGTVEAFDGDTQALSHCHHAIRAGYPGQWPITHQVFCYLPLEHDESIESQEQSIALYSAILDKAPPELQDYAKSTLDYAKQHKEIIDRFGRYPYRNAVLGRDSTAEELEWLTYGQRFGQ